MTMQLLMLADLVTKGVIAHWDKLLVSHPLYSYACSQTRTLCFGVGVGVGFSYAVVVW
jgi:hypothetical protein